MLRAILNDGVSGSSLLLKKALDWLGFLLESGSPVPEGALEQLLKVHSGMACFYHLRRFFTDNDLSESSLIEFHRRIELEEKKTLEWFRAAFLKEISEVAVYSNSSMVKKALAVLNRPLKVDVALCAPEEEGKAMAQSLSTIPAISPRLYADGPYFSRVPSVSAIILGCDAISPGWFVNRSGTRSVVRLAASVGIPVFVVPGPLKRLSDVELLNMPLKQGEAPCNLNPEAVEWENPLLEFIRRESIVISAE
ncbi:MAG: hypothetical protein DRJ08_00835 [Acidobacteria bacterium]|nr:MAG: hypothetical protein DRJ14_02400 [Acidobacteriota bacterium]RLE24495.1 MAG: hypothetical protein DRJ08_00835 [Acidobacteriota bacterium]